MRYISRKSELDLEQWADSHGTSQEIASVIDDMRKTVVGMERLWSDPSKREMKTIIRKAFTLTDEDELYWGCETFTRKEREGK